MRKTGESLSGRVTDIDDMPSAEACPSIEPVIVLEFVDFNPLAIVCWRHRQCHTTGGDLPPSLRRGSLRAPGQWRRYAEDALLFSHACDHAATSVVGRR